MIFKRGAASITSASIRFRSRTHKTSAARASPTAPTTRPPAFVNVTGVARDGWIDFEAFGGAIQMNQATIPSDDRESIDVQYPDGFRVNYDEALIASFHIDMGDERVPAAMRDRVQPPTTPQIGGLLDGRFDFDFKRGRSAQTFP